MHRDPPQKKTRRRAVFPSNKKGSASNNTTLNAVGRIPCLDIFQALWPKTNPFAYLTRFGTSPSAPTSAPGSCARSEASPRWSRRSTSHAPLFGDAPPALFKGTQFGGFVCATVRLRRLECIGMQCNSRKMGDTPKDPLVD